MKRTNLVLVAGLLAATGTVYGSLVFPQSLSNLNQTADLIVLGSSSGNLQAGSAGSFSLNVTRVLKGQSAAVTQSIFRARNSQSP